MTKIYIVIWEDRHTDVTAHPFTDKQTAITEARRTAHAFAKEPDDYQEHDYGKNSGWLFYAGYSCESDCVRVVEVEMDKPLIDR